MDRIIRPNGQPAKINMQEAQLAHKVIMTYLKHNFGDKVELCNCEGCGDVRKLLGKS